MATRDERKRAVKRGASTSGPEVTVVIPAHGVARWLVGCVASALAQGDHVEVIVVDDASPDDGATRVAAAFPDEPRLRIVTNRRAKGVCGARNTGLELARSSWVVFLDGDDELLEGGIGRLLEGTNPGVVGVFGSFRHVDESGLDVASSWLVDRADALARHPQRLLDLGLLPRRTFNPPPGAMLLSVEALFAVGGWDETASGAGRSEDFEVVMRVATCGSVALVDAPVLAYLQRPGSRSTGERNNRRRLRTRAEVVRRVPRSWRPTVGKAQGLAYLRLVAPRLRAVRSDGGARSGVVGVVDLIAAGAFFVLGALCWPLPAWRPSWPALVREEAS